MPLGDVVSQPVPPPAETVPTDASAAEPTAAPTAAPTPLKPVARPNLPRTGIDPREIARILARRDPDDSEAARDFLREAAAAAGDVTMPIMRGAPRSSAPEDVTAPFPRRPRVAGDAEAPFQVAPAVPPTLRTLAPREARTEPKPRVPRGFDRPPPTPALSAEEALAAARRDETRRVEPEASPEPGPALEAAVQSLLAVLLPDTDLWVPVVVPAVPRAHLERWLNRRHALERDGDVARALLAASVVHALEERPRDVVFAVVAGGVEELLVVLDLPARRTIAVFADPSRWEFEV
jgi:hypothetical protein